MPSFEAFVSNQQREEKQFKKLNHIPLFDIDLTNDFLVKLHFSFHVALSPLLSPSLSLSLLIYLILTGSDLNGKNGKTCSYFLIKR